MLIVFAVIGVALVAGVWAVYIRLGVLYEKGWVHDSKVLMEFFKQEFAVLWVAISSEPPKDRANRLKEFGYSAQYLYDEEKTKSLLSKLTENTAR
jgi:hypothetical protein